METVVEAESTKYKIKIANELCAIPEIFELINNPNLSPDEPDAMMNVNIFSRIRIPKTVTEVKNFICFNFNSRKLSMNKDLKTVYFKIVIICHEDDIYTDIGNRHDVISGVIIDKFTWSKFLGFELELISDVEDILENNYYVRTLQFENIAPNSLENGVKMSGN